MVDCRFGKVNDIGVVQNRTGRAGNIFHPPQAAKRDPILYAISKHQPLLYRNRCRRPSNYSQGTSNLQLLLSWGSLRKDAQAHNMCQRCVWRDFRGVSKTSAPHLCAARMLVALREWKGEIIGDILFSDPSLPHLKSLKCPLVSVQAKAKYP